MSDDENAPAVGLTHANVTGKVPAIFKRSVRHRRKGKGKAKLSSDQKRNVGRLQRQGLISQRAAIQHGLPGGKASGGK